MKKKIILFFAATSLYAGAQQITIPDTTFKAYLLENFDTNNDGEISVEAVSYTHLTLPTNSRV